MTHTINHNDTKLSSWQSRYGRFDNDTLEQNFQLFHQRQQLPLHELDALDGASNDALYYAMVGHRHCNVKYLLRRGFDANRLDKEGETPLMSLVSHNLIGIAGPASCCAEMFDELIRYGADPMFLTDHGHSILSYAQPEWLYKCIPHCASIVNKRSRNFDSILLCVAESQDAENVSALRRVGAQPDDGEQFSLSDNWRITFDLIAMGVNTWCWSPIMMDNVQTLPLLWLAGNDLRSLRNELLEMNDYDVELHESAGAYEEECYHSGEEAIERHTGTLNNLLSSDPFATEEKPDIVLWSVRVLEEFALEHCIALQSLHLPALLTMTILQEMLCEMWPNIPDIVYWNVIVTVKHFHDAPDHSTKRRR